MKKTSLLIIAAIIIIVLIIGIVIVNSTPSTKPNENQNNQASQGNTDNNNNSTEDENVLVGEYEDKNKITEEDFGVKGIDLRYGLNDVVSVLGKDCTTTQTKSDEYKLNYEKMGLEITCKQHSAGYIGVERIDIKKEGISTSKGIHVNSSKEDVLNAYEPENILKNGINEKGDNKYIIAVGRKGADYFMENPEERIWYYIENDKVSEIVIWHSEK